MHPILVEQIARQRTNTFEREVDAARLVAFARSAASTTPSGLRELVSRGFAQVRVFVGGAPA
jgi:hypothetical protein